MEAPKQKIVKCVTAAEFANHTDCDITKLNIGQCGFQIPWVATKLARVSPKEILGSGENGGRDFYTNITFDMFLPWMKMSEMVLSSYVGDGITSMLPRKCVVGE